MSFTAIFIALLLERYVIYDMSPLRNWSWLAAYRKVICERMSGQAPHILLAGIVAPLVVGVILIQVLVYSVQYGFINLFYCLAVILYCLGPRNLWADVTTCLTALSEGDAGVLAEKLKQTFGIDKKSFDISTGGMDKQALHKQLLTQIFIQTNVRVFGIVFWYGLVGLAGVVAYRLIAIIAAEQGGDETSTAMSTTAKQALGYLDWPAVRALSFLFALGGNFSKVFAAWMSKLMNGPETNETLLLDCGMASLNCVADSTLPEDGSAENEQLGVIDRSLAITMVILAVMVFIIP